MRPICLILLLVGCYNPDWSAPESARFLCDESMGCPDGLSCVAGKCLRPDELAQLDLAEPAPVPDGAPAQAAAPPCRSGLGFALDAGKTRAACPGKFGAGQAASLCAAGFAICASLAAPEKASCDQIASGFFASTLLASSTGGQSPRCGPSANHTYLAGCGGRRLATGSVSGCSVFDRGLDCFDQGAIGWLWACDGMAGIMEARYSGLPAGGAVVDGVLCCKP